MPEYTGYKGKSLEFLKSNQIMVGDVVKVLTDITYSGIVMPRYEHGDDAHIVLKLGNGYNVGLDISEIKKAEKVQTEREAPRQAEHAPKKEGLPRILLLSTGGTIASKVDYRTGAVTPVLTAEELNSSVPELAEIADIDAKVLLSEYSENIVPEDWVKMAESIKEYAGSGYAGVIVAHGTDTMHYTSSFLSFALAGFPIPIALVGSQRSSDRASSDAALNLIGAARLITESPTPGVYVVMHQDESDNTISCHLGTRVRKNHTSKRGAFQTVGGDPAFIIAEGTIQKNLKGSFYSKKEFLPRTGLNTKVGLVKYHPGYDPRILDGMVDSGCRAVIFEGTGLGHVGRVMYDSIKRAKEKGVFLGMTSQCIDGRTRMTVYESGRDLLNMGIVALKDMIPETALVKAMWAAGNYEESEIEGVMLENVASELSD